MCGAGGGALVAIVVIDGFTSHPIDSTHKSIHLPSIRVQQETRKFEAQKAERWLPAVGEMVHVPRLGSNAKVGSSTAIHAC